MSSINRENIEKIVCGFLKIAPRSIADDQVLAQLTAWNSIKFMQILLDLEKRMDIRFEAHEVVPVKTWGDFMNLVEQKSRAAVI